jgi:hypothetical protein
MRLAAASAAQPSSNPALLSVTMALEFMPDAGGKG